jgi:hypothetical protein
MKVQDVDEEKICQQGGVFSRDLICQCNKPLLSPLIFLVANARSKLTNMDHCKNDYKNLEPRHVTIYVEFVV